MHLSESLEVCNDSPQPRALLVPCTVVCPQHHATYRCSYAVYTPPSSAQTLDLLIKRPSDEHLPNVNVRGAGANLQWVGRSNRLVIYNDRQCSYGSTADDLCAVIYDVVSRKRVRTLPRPVFGLSPDGTVATSVDFIRLQKVRQGESIHLGGRCHPALHHNMI